MESTSPAIAPVEPASRDLTGKASRLPLVNLFGGRVRERVESFHYLRRNDPDHLAADTAEGSAAGFRTFYLK